MRIACTCFLILLIGCTPKGVEKFSMEKSLALPLNEIINSKIESISKNNSGFRLGIQIIIPAGYYTMTGPIRMMDCYNMELVGQGYVQLTFNDDVAGYGINLTGSRDCFIRNITFFGDSPNLLYAARRENLASSGGHVIENCKFLGNTHENVVNIRASELNKFENCRFVNQNKEGFAVNIDNGEKYLSTMQTCYFNNCEFGYSKNLININKADGNTISEIFFNACYFSSDSGQPIIINAGNGSGLVYNICFIDSRAELDGAVAGIRVIQKGNPAIHKLTITGGDWNIHGPLVHADTLLHSAYINNIKVTANVWPQNLPKNFIISNGVINNSYINLNFATMVP